MEKSIPGNKRSIENRCGQLFAEGKKVPHLAAILVGNNGASETYVASKVKSCEEVGFKSTLIRFEADISENKLLEKIEELNHDPDVDGILVQLPLPKHISDEKVINTINPGQRCGWLSSCKCWKNGSGITNFYSCHTSWYNADARTL